jgi:hypothetical protein
MPSRQDRVSTTLTTSCRDSDTTFSWQQAVLVARSEPVAAPERRKGLRSINGAHAWDLHQIRQTRGPSATRCQA